MRERLAVTPAVSLEGSDIDQISLTGYLPPGDIVLQGPVSGYFCGEKRCTSPFASKKPMQSPSDASLLKCMEADCRELNLKAQFLRHLPDISMFAKKLIVLNLSFNMLKILPSSLFAATNLRELYLRNNPLLLISEEIRNLSSLRTLSASFCLLEEIPISIYTLYRLKELDFSYNRIRRIYQKVGNLRALTILNLEGNELPGLPPEVTYLEELKYLKTSNNFMHPFLWNDYLNTQPDHLQDLCLSALMHELYEDDIGRIPPRLSALYNQRSHRCANCELIFFGFGKELIVPSPTPAPSLHSNPVLYSVCAERCVPYLRAKLRQN